MPNLDFLRNLFKTGVTRDEFITAYSEEFKNKTDNSEIQSNSIFDDETEIVAGELFDMLNVNKSANGEPEVLDESEIKSFANFDTTDGDDNISESDFNVLLNNYQKNIVEESENKTPEEMYEEGIKKASGTSDPVQTYLQTLEYNISTLETLSENRQSSSLSAITQYRVELNELVQNDDSVSKDLKSQYKKETANLNSLEKEGVRLDAQIKQKQTELEEANSDYENLNENIDYAAEEYSEDDEKTPDYSKQLSNAEKNISKLESDLSGLQTKRTKNSQSITNSKTNISSLQDKIKSQSVTLKQKMNEINQKIEAEQAKCEKDIQSYNNSITALKNAQSYAVSKVQENSAKSYSSSNESVGNGSDTYVYDESNYDSAAVSALEQKWSKIAKKQGLDTKFFQKVTAIAKDLKCDPNALLSVMNSESGLNSSAVNKNGGATGLIQFMPSTAKAYGTTTQQLAKMSAYDQLDYVAKFLISTKKTAKMGDSTLSAADLYSLIFLPGRANRDVLTSSGEKYYSANAGLDMDGDGKITKSDLEKRMKKFSA